MRKYETEQKRTKKKICKQQMHLFRNINAEKLKRIPSMSNEHVAYKNRHERMFDLNNGKKYIRLK